MAKTNLKSEMSKFSRHDVARYEGLHDLKESPSVSIMHVECVDCHDVYAYLDDFALCVDCHNPHAVQDTIARAPVVPGPMRGVSGVTASGSSTERVQYE